MPIDDWIYWGEDPWQAGIIWKEWIDGAQIDCVTTCDLDVTYIARPTVQADLVSTVSVVETFIPQAGATIICSSNCFVTPSATYPTAVDTIVCASTTSAIATQSFSLQPDTIACTSTTSLSETYTDVTQPDEVSGLQAWYDASDYSTVIDGADGLPVEEGDNGAKISEWSDKQGSNDLTDGATSSRRPTWAENQQNGLPTISFDGTDEFLIDNGSGGVFANNEPYTFLMVSTGAASIGVVWNGTNDPAIQFFHETTISRALLRNNSATEAETNSATAPFWSAVVVDSSGLYIRDSGGNSSTTTITPGTLGTGWNLYVGWDVLNDTYDAGEVCEILIYDVALSNTDIDDLGEYFEAKWGL